MVGASQKPERFRTSTAAVVVDVVVHDRQGRPVLGLAATDFTIYEDSVLQTITSFDAVGDTDGGSAPEEGQLSRRRLPAAPASRRVPAVVALVFEQLSPEGRQLAEKAASVFVNDVLTPSDGVAVFNLDRALHLVVPYTARLCT